MPTDDSLRLPPSLNLSFPKITSACNDDAIRTRLGVNFQEVVHSAPAVNADVPNLSDSRGTEWTPTRMLL
jgi:hypothetical protein